MASSRSLTWIKIDRMDRHAQMLGFFSRMDPTLPQDELEGFLRQGTELRVAAGELFCPPGNRKHQIGFLHEGIVRYHVLTDAGDDITKDFSFAGSFTVSFGSAVRREPAAVAISAVEDALLTVWPYERLWEIYER